MKPLELKTIEVENWASLRSGTHSRRSDIPSAALRRPGAGVPPVEPVHLTRGPPPSSEVKV